MIELVQTLGHGQTSLSKTSQTCSRGLVYFFFVNTAHERTQRVQIECHHGIRAQEPYGMVHCWDLIPSCHHGRARHGRGDVRRVFRGANHFLLHRVHDEVRVERNELGLRDPQVAEEGRRAGRLAELLHRSEQPRAVRDQRAEDDHAE